MYARPICTRRRVDEQWTVSRDRLSIQHQWVYGVRHKVSENAGKRRRCVHSWNPAECLIDRLCEFRVLSLPASKEKGFALADGTASLKSKLMQLNLRFRRSLRTSEKLIRIERGVPHKLEDRSMKLIRAAAGRGGDGRSAVTAFFGRGIVGGDFVFLHVVGGQPVQIRERVRYRRFVGFNAIHRHVDGSVAGAVNVNARTGSSGRPLNHAGFQGDQRERITSIERKIDDRLTLDDVADGRIGRLQYFSLCSNAHGLGDSSNLQ